MKTINLKSSKRSRNLLRLFQKFQSFIILFILTPIIYSFAIFFAIPQLAEEFQAGTAKICMHILICTFFLMNITGNMIMSMFTDTSFYNYTNGFQEWNFCEYCNKKRPNRSWHCHTCDKCILKRDHHCMYFSTCIGHFNQRYYLLFLGYLFLSMLYALYYNCYYFEIDKDWMSLFYPLARLLNPMLNLIVQEEWKFKDLTIIILIANIALIIWSFSLFFYHMRNVLKGGTYAECEKTGDTYDLGWQENIIQVFGRKWYIIWLCPLLSSPLPSDGINWNDLKVK